MKYRTFGATELLISEYGFGAWGIGGKSYGPVEKTEALRALSVAQEHGCNFIDTAQVYGDSEMIIGEFLKHNRDKWILSTKYSGQKGGLTRTLEKQLKDLKTDNLDFYQIHWMPPLSDPLFRELEKIKIDGKARYVGISLYNQNDIKSAVGFNLIDGFQVACNLIEPYPYVQNIDVIKKYNKGILIRSSLKSGLLSGKYNINTKFNDSYDLRTEISSHELRAIFTQIEKFKFLSENSESLLYAAARYPLSFKETSCVLLGTKNSTQAKINFHDIPKAQLSDADLKKIEILQKQLGLFTTSKFDRVLSRFKKIVSRSYFFK